MLEVQGWGLAWGFYLRPHNKCLSGHEAANLSRLKKNVLCRETKSNNNGKDGWSTVAENREDAVLSAWSSSIKMMYACTGGTSRWEIRGNIHGQTVSPALGCHQ
jgi:hypothetical protein